MAQEKDETNHDNGTKEIRWVDQFRKQFDARTCHTFLFYLNVNDFVLRERRLETLQGFLQHSHPANKAKIVAYYHRGLRTIEFVNAKMETWFNKLTWEPAMAGRRESLSSVFARLDQALHLSCDNPEVKEIFSGEPLKKDQPLLAVIVDFVDTLSPTDAPSSSSEEDRDIYVTLRSWARDQEIGKNNNLILLITDALTAVPVQLREVGSGISPVKIPIPNLTEREQTIGLFREKYPDLKADVSDDTLAHMTAGLTRSEIRSLVQESVAHKRILTSNEIFLKKKKILEEKSGGLIEIKRPIWGMETIGGLTPVKKFLEDVAAAMENNDALAVPMGILCVGPPGTGKTVTAEALANVIGVPLVILKNIREMWVGQSERNQDFAYELIQALAPVIVFQDEIDQQMQKRGMVFHGDSGVSARLAARQFEIMSDTALRGKIVWFAATNRPDLLDNALLRPGRFDEKIPFLPPVEVVERKEIFNALLIKMAIKAGAERQDFDFEITNREAVELAKKACAYLSKKTNTLCKDKPANFNEDEYEIIPYTGAEIEVILSKAYRLARLASDKILRAEHVRKVMDEYIPGQDLFNQKILVDLALQVIDSEEFLTDHYRKRARDLRRRSRLETMGGADNSALGLYG